MKISEAKILRSCNLKLARLRLALSNRYDRAVLASVMDQINTAANNIERVENPVTSLEKWRAWLTEKRQSFMALRGDQPLTMCFIESGILEPYGAQSLGKWKRWLASDR